MNAYAFEEPTACFVFGDFKKPQTLTRAHRQCMNPEEGGGRESATPWKITSSIGFYRKCNLAPSPWKRLDPHEICDPPVWTLQKL